MRCAAGPAESFGEFGLASLPEQTLPVGVDRTMLAVYGGTTRERAVMAGFIQIIEFKTSRIDEIEALSDELRAQREGGSVRRGTITADRDRPGYYLNVIEFDSHESAMENSDDPATGKFAAKMAELCDGPARFYNLDVRDTWERGA